MTIQEALAKGLEVTAVGLLIVFSVLLILMIVLKIMEKIFYKKPDKVKEIQKPTAEKIQEEIKPISADIDDEEELIAVLTAAIAASLNTSTYNLKIKSYRRVSAKSPAWNKAGLNDTINSRL